MAKVEVELFTHPICTGCWDAKKVLEQVARELPDLVAWRGTWGNVGSGMSIELLKSISHA